MGASREMVSFSSIGGIAQCFRALAADPDIHILRVKNKIVRPHSFRSSSSDLFSAKTSRRSLSSHTEAQGGFRYLVVNLTFQSEEARALAVHGHVCELLLVHLAQASKLCPDAHQRHLKVASLPHPLPLPLWPALAICWGVRAWQPLPMLLSAAAAAAAVLAPHHTRQQQRVHWSIAALD
eukprot:841543-Rhodomonas_salina.1